MNYAIKRREEKIEELRQQKTMLCRVRKIVANADELLTPKSWIKGNYRLREPDGLKMCSIGAVLEAAERDGQNKCRRDAYYAEAVAELDRATGRPLLKESGSAVIYFNDNPTTSFSDVKKVFQAALANIDTKIERFNP